MKAFLQILATSVLLVPLWGAGHPFQANDFVSEAVKELSLAEVSNYQVDFLHLVGLQMILKEQKDAPDPNHLSNHFGVSWPTTLLPSPYPRELFELFELAKELQEDMALVHLRASLDHAFLKEATREVAKVDKVVGPMVEIMDAVVADAERNGGRRRQEVTLILQRSDYLTHKEEGKHAQLKQIEVTSGTNAGQGGGYLMSKVHQRVLEKVKHSSKGELPQWLSAANVEENGVIHGQAKALYEAWKIYKEQTEDPDAIILLISAPKRRQHSHFEQLLWAQFELENIAWAERERPHVKQITIQECTEKLQLDESTFNLHIRDAADPFVDGKKVAVAVFLDGYLPDHYPSDRDWAMRRQMERSTAIMSPNVFVYLMGTKKVQQELARPGVLERLLPGREEAVRKLRGTFIQMWGLGSGTQEEQELIEHAIEHNEEYVLKENLEAGKGNHFCGEMAKKLRELKGKEHEMSAYILQKRIKPFSVQNASIPHPPLPETGIQIAAMDSEISIFGSLVARGDNAELNTYDGYLVRTKLSSKDQCTVSSGQGGIDSLVLFREADFLLHNQQVHRGDRHSRTHG